MFTAKTFQQYRATAIQLLTRVLFTEYNFFRMHCHSRSSLSAQEQQYAFLGLKV